jgi:hypothetical protein
MDEYHCKVSDYLDDGDELLTELISYDIWLHINIVLQIDTLNLKERQIKLNADLDMRVNRNWTNKRLKKIV